VYRTKGAPILGSLVGLGIPRQTITFAHFYTSAQYAPAKDNLL